MTFTGFPERALIFYEGLEADNSKTYWTAHRQTYEEDVKAPMLAMLAELEPEFGPSSVYRPYRDVRFSRDKTPYKTAIAAGGGGGYVQLSADGLLVAGGYYDTTPGQVERLRRAVADDVQGPALERVVGTLRRGGWEIGGQRLKTKPRGYDADHPRIELLKHRTLIAHRHWAPAPWLHTARAKQRVQKAWRELADLDRWLASNVGPGDQPR